ncbi:MAG: glycoside hydrolase family 99-like domain-containing protein, partial [Anaerolineae bacterium]
LDVAARHGFAAAVDFEVTGPFFETQADVVAGLEHLLAVHTRHPAYLHVGGRPVIFFWRQNRFPVETWYDIRDRVDPERSSIWIMEGVDLSYLGPFDGTHLYSVAWDSEPGATLRRWGEQIRQWNAEHGSVKYWVATVMPGYNDLVTGRSDAFVRDRAGGAYYRDCWEGAIQSKADWVVITSFNEWLEGSQIEPSQAYGEQYLELTRELGTIYRSSEPLPPGVPAAPIIVNPTQAPASAPAAANVVAATATFTPATAVPPPTATALPVATPSAAPSPTIPSLPTETLMPLATATSLPRPAPTPTVLPTPPSTAPASLQQAAATVLGNLGLVAAVAAAVLVLGMALRRRR